MSGSGKHFAAGSHRQRRGGGSAAGLALLAAIGLGSQAGWAGAQEAGAQPVAAVPLMTRPLAGIDGREGTMLTVEYAPGAASPPHRHNASTFVYVLEGSVVMQVAGGDEVTLGEGETFFESPSDVHTVSRNASDSEPARILVFMVKEQGAPVTVPVD